MWKGFIVRGISEKNDVFLMCETHEEAESLRDTILQRWAWRVYIYSADCIEIKLRK